MKKYCVKFHGRPHLTTEIEANSVEDVLAMVGDEDVCIEDEGGNFVWSN